MTPYFLLENPSSITALKQYAIYDHPKYGKIYAFEVDGFGNHLLMDDANVPPRSWLWPIWATSV